jgi:hypothetical protein
MIAQEPASRTSSRSGTRSGPKVRTRSLSGWWHPFASVRVAVCLVTGVLAGESLAQDEDGTAASPAAATDAADGRAGLRTVLWVAGGSERLDADRAAAIRALGFDAIQAAAGEEPTVAVAAGLGLFRHQLVGKGVLEHTDEQWRRLHERYATHRDGDEIQWVRPLASPLVRADLTLELGRALERLTAFEKAVPGVEWLAASLADEASTTRHANPLDLDRSPHTLRAFRRDLTVRYATVQALAKAWNAPIRPFADVLPPTTDEIRAREFDGETLPRVLTPWNDALDFADRQFAEVVSDLVRHAAERAPALPVGLTGMQPPSAFGGHDLRRLAASLGLFEAYDIGGARDLVECFVPADARQLATLFVPEDGGADRSGLRRMAAELGEHVAHGVSFVVAWNDARLLETGVDGIPEPNRAGRALAALLEEYAPAAARFGGGRVLRDPVWIVESQPSVRAHWMLDSIGDGPTWIRRLSSYEAEHGTSLAARQSWFELLADLGIQAYAVSEDDLVGALASGRGPRLVVLPATLALSGRACEELERYVAGGGVLLGDHACAFYDETLTLRARPGLDAVFGVESRSTPSLDQLSVSGARARAGALRTARGEAVAESGLRGGIGEPVLREPVEGLRAAAAVAEGVEYVQLERRLGRGRAVLLNLAVCEYRELRLDPERSVTARSLRDRVRRVLEDAGVEPRVTVRGEGLPTLVEVLRVAPAANDPATVLLAVRLDGVEDRRVAAALAGRRGAFACEMVLDAEYAVTLLGPEPRPLGSGRRFGFELDPWRPTFFALRRLDAAGK